MQHFVMRSEKYESSLGFNILELNQVGGTYQTVMSFAWGRR
jgi:hypothetical protein